MALLFAFEAVVILLLYIAAKNKYKTLLNAEEAQGYHLRLLMPSTLLVLELLGYRYNNKYDRKITKTITALYGTKSAELHTKLFYSSKLAVMLAAFCIATLFGAAQQKIEVTYVGFTLVLPILLFLLIDNELETRRKKKYDKIRADFPDIVSKLVLLVNAGMTVNRAWEKVCSDSKKDTPLYRELKTTYLQIQGGKPENEAYEEFAKRCKVKEITKFISLIIQNMKKGNGDLVPLLKLQADECWEHRKARAKQLGEEASAKLILPMMIMFIGILIIVILPAIMQLNNI